MILSISGTPGVGKTTIARILAEKLGYEYVSLRDFALRHGIGEGEEELEIDVDELVKATKKEFEGRNVVFDGHLSHLIPSDFVIILRLHPRLIGERLSKRGYPKKKVSENVEAELVDVCLVEAIESNENIIEVDTTNKTPEEIVEEILNLMKAGVKRRFGIVDWSEVYDDVIPYLNLGGE